LPKASEARLGGAIIRRPVVPLGVLVTRVKTALGVRGGLRVIGDPKASIRRVALLPGSTPITAALEVLPSVDAIVAGEVREWETVEYARDAIDSGHARGLILVGRVVSEEPGMRALAGWLETIVPEVRVRHIAAGDPYWRP
jgi:putative NIF3 family GTP cyclohydrolase 1 type 2